MRQPSTTMSCVAEAKAVTSAQTTMKPRLSPGAPKLIPTRPAATVICASSIQPRRRPSQRDSTGASARSITGAHTNFSE